MDEIVNIDIITDLLTLGGVGFLGGVLLPWAFRLVGYVVDGVRKVIE